MKLLNSEAKTNWKYVAIVILVTLFTVMGVLIYFVGKQSPRPSHDQIQRTPLVKVFTHGGLCPTGECRSQIVINRDGTFVYIPDLNIKVEQGTQIKGSINPQKLSFLAQSIEQSNFTEIKEKKFTEICPTAYDGSEAVYTFYIENGVEEIASCTVAIDRTSSPFQVLDEIINNEIISRTQGEGERDDILDTSAWQTYRNDEFGFEVRYPADVVPIEGNFTDYGRIAGQGLKLISADKKAKLGKEECAYGETDHATTCRAEFEDGIAFVVLPEKFAYFQARFKDFDAGIGIPAREETIGGRKGLYFATNFEHTYLRDYYYIPFEEEKTLFIEIVTTATYYAYSSQKDETLYTYSPSREMVDQILSTFRFVETPKLKELLNSNTEFNELFQTVVTANDGFSSEDFSRGSSMPISIDFEYAANPEDITYPVWTVSPDGSKAISAYTSFGEPDSSLSIYNRNNQGKVERLEFCGTPCFYWGTLWLNNDQFIFIQGLEYHPPGEARCSVGTKCTSIIGISLFDLKENVQVSYESPEVEPGARLMNWPDWGERIMKLR